METTALARDATAPWDAEASPLGYAPPPVDLPPYGRAELRAWFREGEPEADACERILASAARARGALDVAIAEGLDACAPASGSRRSDATSTTTPGRSWTSARVRPRASPGSGASCGRARCCGALRSGRVRLRAAQTVLAVAAGEREAEWVKWAARLTVLELEDAVRRAGGDAVDADEPWVRLGAHLRPDERTLLDEALALAGETMPGSSRMEQLEALSQEFLAECERQLEAERDRQMRAHRRIAVPMPRRIAVLVAAAIRTVRDRADRVLSTGKCLAIIAWHFLETWRELVKRPRSRSRNVRDRDDGYCQVPECSRGAAHSHHVEFRSLGGGDEPENQVGVCAFHHLRCIHGGWLRVLGRAPAGLTWFLRGEAWAGPLG